MGKTTEKKKKTEKTTERPKRDFNIRCFYEDDKVEISYGATQTIIPAHETTCPAAYMLKLTNGEIVAGGSQGFPAPAPTSWRRSKDGGKTWSETPGWPTHNAYQFPDGEIIHLSSSWLVDAATKGDCKVVLYRSTDNGYTHKEGTATITGMPELFEFSPDGPEGRKARYGYIDHAIVKLNDDSLLACAHVAFTADYEKSFKWRTVVFRSVDRGNTWQYLATVAFDLTKEQNPRMDGFCEPHLLLLPNGEILCFMRTGGAYKNRRYTPLHMSRSADNGRTWSNANPVADRGVYPTSCLMANGVIAVVYGRPGDWVMFSLDDGHTWLGHFCLYNGALGYDAGNYDWILPVAADTVLVAYARTDPNDPDGLKNVIVGTYVTVKRK